jgi:hypothetical protein
MGYVSSSYPVHPAKPENPGSNNYSLRKLLMGLTIAALAAR